MSLRLEGAVKVLESAPVIEDVGRRARVPDQSFSLDLQLLRCPAGIFCLRADREVFSSRSSPDVISSTTRFMAAAAVILGTSALRALSICVSIKLVIFGLFGR